MACFSSTGAAGASVPAGFASSVASASAACCRLALLVAQLPHGEELQHPVLHVAERVVILIEDLRRLDEVEVLLGAGVPRQLGDGLEVCANDLRLHRLATDAIEPAELAVDFAPRILGQVERVELLAQLLEVRRFVVLAQFLADGLELLAQEHLALPVAQLLLDAGLDVLLGVEHADLPLQVHEHAPQPLLDREALEQALALGRGDVDVTRHQVGEPAGIVDAAQHLLDDLLRQPGLLAQLGGAGPRLAVQRHERRIVRVERRHLLGGAHDGGEIAVLLEVVHRDAAVLALQQQLHAGETPLHLADAGHGADGVEHVGVDALHVLPLRHREDQLLGRGEGGLDRLQRTGPASTNRRGDAGKEHDLPERKHRKRQAFIHYLGSFHWNPAFAAQATSPARKFGREGAPHVPRLAARASCVTAEALRTFTPARWRQCAGPRQAETAVPQRACAAVLAATRASVRCRLNLCDARRVRAAFPTRRCPAHDEQSNSWATGCWRLGRGSNRASLNYPYDRSQSRGCPKPSTSRLPLASLRRWAPPIPSRGKSGGAAWASCIARATSSSSAGWPSRCCRPNSRSSRTSASASSARRRRPASCSIPTSCRSTRSARRRASSTSSWATWTASRWPAG